VHAAQALRARRVLVLVPTLGLLAQTVSVWRQAGRRGPMFGACSLSGEDARVLRCTTDEAELVGWVADLELVTVFATYASLGLGVLERSHRAGLAAWDLVVVDEAHRTSGALGKAWAGVHDDARVPALRRLYMTATPRLWEVADRGEPGEGELVASMDDEAVFGPVVYRLPLSEAIERGLIARYQVVCVDIADPGLSMVELVGGSGRTAQVRGVRLAALQTAVMKASAERRLRRVLTFHYRTREAEAFSSGLGVVAKGLWESDPGLYPQADAVWADWLCGEHKPAHRGRVLEEFASDPDGDLEAAWVRVLSSVRVLGEGVDTKECDAVVFADVRGSAVDIVQAVGRALRMQPGEGKVASLVVPVFLGPGEEPDEMLVSRAYGELVKVLTALRAHDSQAVEQLAMPQVTGGEAAGEVVPAAGGGVSKGAEELLSFSQPRDPAQLAAFISLRVLHPESQFWRRGLAAALAYRSDRSDLAVPYEYRTPDGFALGVWIARQRSSHTRGELSEERVGQLDELGMIWSHTEVAFAEGLSAAREWAREHGHLLAPAEAMWEGYPVGVWLKNQRAAARKDKDGQGKGGLSTQRRQALEGIDPSWCPSWSVSWQRCFHLARLHVHGGQALPEESRRLVIQGDDLGMWAATQRRQWDTLGSARQWLLQEALGLGPQQDSESEKCTAAPRRTRAQVWSANVAAARQYQQREGNLEVPHRHVEEVDGAEHTLGVFITNSRSRRAQLSPERVAELSELGMRWA
jgi:superfamily II DNA or RNA helicase